MKLVKSLNWIQLFLKLLITILLIVFLILEITYVKNKYWFEVLIAVCAITFLTFLLQSAIEFPITGYSNNLAIIPLALCFLPLINKLNKNKRKVPCEIDEDKLKPTTKEKINANRVKISYLIACISIRAILNTLLILIFLWNSVSIHWILAFGILMTVEITFDILLTTNFIKDLIRNSKMIVERSLILEN